MSKRLLQWLRRTRMPEFMIWYQYRKHQKEELDSRFQKPAGNGPVWTFEQFIEKLKERGITLLSPESEEATNSLSRATLERIALRSYACLGDNNSIFIEFPNPNDLENYLFVTNFGSKKHFAWIILRIPLLNNLAIGFEYWKLELLADYLEHIPEFFDQWMREVKLIRHEILKKEKIKRMNMMKANLFERRKFESSIQSRYGGHCKIENNQAVVEISLKNGHNVMMELSMPSLSLDWKEDGILEALNSIVDYALEEAAKEERNPMDCYYPVSDDNIWSLEVFPTSDGMNMLFRKMNWREKLQMNVHIS